MLSEASRGTRSAYRYDSHASSAGHSFPLLACLGPSLDFRAIPHRSTRGNSVAERECPRGVMISASGASTPADGGNEALYQLRAALDARERRLEALQSILDKKSEEAAAVHASYSMMYDELQMCASRITHRPSSARHAACRTRV